MTTIIQKNTFPESQFENFLKEEKHYFSLVICYVPATLQKLSHVIITTTMKQIPLLPFNELGDWGYRC